MRAAIVGSGIAGLTCAHVLGPHHDVVRYEAADRPGGHTNTVGAFDPVAGELGVDTGFIVHNDRNYPSFIRLLDELGIDSRPSEMSFGVGSGDRPQRRRWWGRSPTSRTGPPCTPTSRCCLPSGGRGPTGPPERAPPPERPGGDARSLSRCAPKGIGRRPAGRRTLATR